MKTLTPEEFKKQYGTVGLKQVQSASKAPVAEKKSSFEPIVQGAKDLGNMFVNTAKGIGQSYQEAGQDIKQQFQDSASGKTDPLLAGLHSVGSLAKATVAPITSALGVATQEVANDVSKYEPVQKAAMSSTGDAVASAQQQVQSKIEEIKTKYPELTRTADDLYNIVSLLIPEKLGEAKEPISSKTPKGTLVRESSPVSPSQSPEALSSTLSRKLYEVGIGRNTAEAERTLNYRANKEMGIDSAAPTTRATVAQKYGISGRQSDIGVQAKVTGTKLYKDQILPELRKSPEILTKEDLFNPLQEKIKSIVDPSRRAELQDAYDALTEEYAGESKWNLEKAQELKSGIDKYTPDKVFKGKPIANAYNELRHDMADAIRTFTYDKLKNEGIKQKYLDYGNLKELQKLGVEGLANNKLKGGAGSFISGLYEKAVTPITTGLGKVLYKIEGTPVTFKGEPGIKNFKQFLQSKGYDVNLK